MSLVKISVKLLITKLITSFIFIFYFVPLELVSEEPVTNVLLYQDAVQVSTEINQYEDIIENRPIHGTVMITHDGNNKIDMTSFRLGEKPLKIKWMTSTPMSSTSDLTVTIFNFQLEGMEKGEYTLAPITVKVGGKEYAALPLKVRVPNK